MYRRRYREDSYITRISIHNIGILTLKYISATEAHNNCGNKMPDMS